MSKEFDEDWPRRINVTKVLTYDTEIIYDQILEDNRASNGDLDIELDDIIEKIYTYVKDDFSCGWGHEVNIRDLIIQDENGEEY
jgi:hypothetical protein